MKEINNYPNYKVGIDGTIISYKFQKQRVLKPQMVTQSLKKYMAVGLYNEHNKRNKYGLTPSMHYLHRLVWETYVGEIPSHLEIEHLDQNPHNNHLSNLKLVTRKENIENHTRSKYGFLYTEKRDEIIQDYKELGTYDLVAEKWGCSPTTIYRVIKNKVFRKSKGKYLQVQSENTCDDHYTQNDMRGVETRKKIGLEPTYSYRKDLKSKKI
jgi:hypothetical protein